MAAKKFSFPKERISVLLLENIHANAVALFETEGYQIERLAGSLSEDELAERISSVSILGIRSNTTLSAKVLGNAKRLLAVGAFCIGTNQIDLDETAARGIAVFNAPFSNTRSVVELAIAEIISMSRRLTDRNTSTHAGEWDKSADGCHEIRGRRLGIVGYGNIGSQLSVIAENLGMEVYYFDLEDRLAFGNAQKCGSLEELLGKVDVVTSHVDGRTQNKALFGAAEFAAMRKGALFLNLSRGMVVEAQALRDAIVSGHLAGAAIDVFMGEPKRKGDRFESVLQGLPNVILTPHVASGTEEAQASIGSFVGSKLVNFINHGSTALSVNLPGMTLPVQEGSHRLILIHQNVPGVMARVNTLLADHSVNIDGQYLGTKGEAGYLITDVAATYPEDLTAQLREMPETIRLRVLY